MAKLRIEITRRPDGSGVLRCTRGDGSATWQKQESKHAAFFALHDLTHFAVESTLGYRHGFFGLIADGWDVADTTGKGARGPLPDEAAEVEYVVGVFDMERASSTLWTAEEFNENSAIQASAAGRSPMRRLTDEDLGRVRAKRGELFSRWFQLAPGQSIVLEF